MSTQATILTRLSSSIAINDIGFRIIFIPIIGISIGIFSGIVNATELNLWKFKMAYGFCILISFIIWNGNRYLLNFLRSYFNWIDKPLHKLLAIVLIIPAFTLPVSFLLLYSFYHLFYDVVDYQKINATVIAIMIVTAFIVHIYETAYTVKEVENEKINKSKLEQLKAESELEALKSQLDPHFMINSLNTLSYLIDHDQQKAIDFNRNLAELFRYMLQGKDKDFVFLGEEIDFLKKYLSMIGIRFGDSIRVNIDIPTSIHELYLLPSVCLQLLAENAIKHSIFSKSSPLTIDVYVHNDVLEFRNNVFEFTQVKNSTGIGLKNLNQRVKLLMGSSITIVNNFDHFIVKIPMKKI